MDKHVSIKQLIKSKIFSMKISTLLLLSLLFISCTSDSKETVSEIDFTLKSLSTSPFSNVVREYSIVPLETNDQSLIANVRKIACGNDIYLILHSVFNTEYKICIFDLAGKFVNVINAQGGGPEEYLHISDFDIHPLRNIVSIVDPGNNEILDFDVNGSFLRSRKVDYWLKQICYLVCNDNVVKIITDTRSSKVNGNTNYDLFISDEFYNIEERYFPYKKPISVGMGNALFYYKLDGFVGYYRPHTDLVYALDCNGLSLRYKIDFPAEVLPSELTLDFLQSKVPGSEYTYFINYFESSSILVFTFTYDKTNYIGLYDKQSGNELVIKNPPDPSCDCGKVINIKGVCNNWFVLLADISNIHSILEAMDPKRNKCIQSDVFPYIDQLDYNSNPVLILIKFTL